MAPRGTGADRTTRRGQTRSGPRGHGGGIGSRIEGTHAVGAAVAAGRGRVLSVERHRLRHDDVAALVDRARTAGVDVRLVDSVVDLAESESPQGLVLDAIPVPLHSVDEFAGDDAAILVLDHIEDPHNVGAAARSALAAGMTGLVVPERRAAPLGASTFKAAAGALEHLPISVVSSTADAIARLKERHVWTVGLAADAPEPLFAQSLLAEPVAVVIGSEAKGMGTLVRDRLDLSVSIPMSPLVESLNASVTAALVAFEIARMRFLSFWVSVALAGVAHRRLVGTWSPSQTGCKERRIVPDCARDL